MKLFSEEIRKVIDNASVSYIATSDSDRCPHIAMEKGLKVIYDKHIGFNAWFCKKTVENLHNNPKIAIAVLDSSLKRGYQFLGKIVAIEDGAMLNGFSPELEKNKKEIPQVETRLKIKIDAILDFSAGPHSDKIKD